ncbi:MAG: hypothetical protein L0Y57_07505 [Beijerinckiaceae bacterium]|nr:hypothetical protein [Beijerinckiaceae bacterium]
MTTTTKEPEGQGVHSPAPGPSGGHAVGTPPLDLKKYQSHVEDFDLTAEQKVELLQTLWAIMTAFVDLGFGVDAVQLLRTLNASDSLNSGADEVEERKPLASFNRIARDPSAKEEPS